MSKERMELRKTEKDLLEFSAGDLIPMLENDKKAIHYKQTAFIYYSEKRKEIFEVQVTVTRHVNNFLEPFQIEQMYGYDPKKRLK